MCTIFTFLAEKLRLTDMANLRKLLINVSVLRAWRRRGDYGLSCNLCPPGLFILAKGVEEGEGDKSQDTNTHHTLYG